MKVKEERNTKAAKSSGLTNLNYRKDREFINSFIRNSSCSSGWVKIALQTTFATLTVSSFILIVSMSLNISLKLRKTTDSSISSCEIQYCRVVCTRIPFYGLHEDDIIIAVTEASQGCEHVYLTLDQPLFEEYTMQANWLSTLKSEVYELALIGGNLQYFAKDAFVSDFGKNLKSLVFQRLTISVLSPTIFEGLSSLERLAISNCLIKEIKENALGEVAKTVSRLTITRSGFWNPVNVTGATQDILNLRQINFSSNNFSTMIDKHTFSSIIYCETLNLNRNRITAIGTGAFDNLLNIQIIYLYNNLLVTIPSGLFNKILTLNPKATIDLLSNPWLCNCSSNALLLVISKGALHNNPLCSSPQGYEGVTFTNFFQYCSRNSQIEVTINETHVDKTLEINDPNHFYTNSECRRDKRIFKKNVSLISPLSNYQCLSSVIKISNIIKIRYISKNITLERNDSWITPTFFVRNNILSMLEIGTKQLNSSYGLVWYHTTCPNDVYCINVFPKCLRMHNVDSTAKYVFCPLSLITGIIDYQHCIVYSFNNKSVAPVTLKEIWHYVFTAIGFLAFGALFIYTIIRLKPGLLKGSKRVVLIKHKSIEALVLPPQTSLQNTLKRTEAAKIIHERFTHTKKTLIVLGNRRLSSTERLARNSTRSCKSITPSYISALQPTDEQMLEWRLRQNFDNSAAVIAMNSDLSVFTKVYNRDLPFFSNAENKEFYKSN